ncbi:right-handed parallel beta-helix repeat-containing protein [Levilinea saccharolytica]|uniref:Right handed beta helix domain-containing protein n=1 Tax=Levilinea saccharolytica TaxID=229921 RepID=A0A0P6X8J3_9CHLR|nr:right-handed parallel beta-helix repeat-containing protein [Levilinea saccharolytica]KPL75756.1 hypothetical protein ADN01_18235 [Levilinea saccharolytica]GAP16714.1 right handed beta helix region [Levilinea saccharolytica]
MQSRFTSMRWLLAAVLVWVSFLPQFPVQAQSEPPGGEMDAEAVFYPDPGAFFTADGMTYAFTPADCNPLADGEQPCDNPLQAAANALLGLNLTPVGGKIYIGAGVYDLEGAADPGPHWVINGTGWTSLPSKLTLVGMGSAVGSPMSTELRGIVNLTNLGSVTVSNLLIRSGGLVTSNMTGTLNLERVQVMDGPANCVFIGSQQGAVTAAQVVINGCGAIGIFAEATGGLKMTASHITGAGGSGINLIVGNTVTMLNVSSSSNVGDGLYLVGMPDTAPRVSLTAVSTVRNQEEGAQVITRGAVSVDRSVFVGNAGVGLLVDNSGPDISQPVTVLRSQFLRNAASANIYSSGRILMDGIRSEANSDYPNIVLNNSWGTQPIQFTNRFGPNVLANNEGTVSLFTQGQATVTGVSAVHSQGIDIGASNGSVTVSRVRITASQSAPGLAINSGGRTTLADVQVNRTNSVGITVLASNENAPMRILRTQSNGNSGPGFSLNNPGRVQISQVEASNNGAYGMLLSSTPSQPKGWWVTVQQSSFNYNKPGFGLNIGSTGGVQMKKISASNNGAQGARVEIPTSANFQMSGKPGDNVFQGNGGAGLSVAGVGKLVLAGVDASYNTAMGVEAAATLPQDFLLTNVQANANGVVGLSLNTAGTMLLKNVAADANNVTGLSAVNPYTADTRQGVTLLSSHFDINQIFGAQIVTNGPVLLNGVSASYTRERFGLQVIYSNPEVPVEKVEFLSTLGKNYFDGNGSNGLLVLGAKSFTGSYVSVRNNGQFIATPGMGVSGVDAPVTLTCAVVTGNPADGIQVSIGAALLKIVNGMVEGNARLDPDLFQNVRLNDPGTTLDLKPGVCSGW